MKSLPWLRLYTEIIDDEKLGLLAFEDRWHFVALLCLKGKGVLDNEPDAEMLARKVALKMGLTCAELEKVVLRLSRMNLIDRETFQPVAWDMRQMHSDTDPTNAQRQHRHRMKNKGVTPDNALRNAPITRIDTDTEVDTDKEEANASVARTSLPTCPTSSIVDLYHEVLPELPVVRLLGAPRKRAISSFWKFVLTSKRSDGTVRATDAASALEWTRAYFERTRLNNFLMGRGQKAQGHEEWVCSIDFLMSEKGRIQVIEKTKDSA